MPRTMDPDFWITNHLNNKQVKDHYSDVSSIHIATPQNKSFWKNCIIPFRQGLPGDSLMTGPGQFYNSI